MGDFPGEATKEPHVDWINVLAVSTGADRSSSNWADSTLQDIVVTKESDKSTPKLVESILTGKVHDKVVIDFVISNPTSPSLPELPYLIWELRNARITSYSFNASDANELPTEEYGLTFDALRVTYIKYDEQGQETDRVQTSIVLKGKNILEN